MVWIHISPDISSNDFTDVIVSFYGVFYIIKKKKKKKKQTKGLTDNEKTLKGEAVLMDK